MLGNGTGPLARWFSRTEVAMAARVSTEMDEVQRSEDVTAKWAELEAKVPTQTSGKKSVRNAGLMRSPLRFIRGEPMSECQKDCTTPKNTNGCVKETRSPSASPITLKTC